MSLNSNTKEHEQSMHTLQQARQMNGHKLLSQKSEYFNISNYQYNIITNRQKPNRTSMPTLVAAETRANKLKTFLRYWNDENFFDPIRNSKEKFDNSCAIKGLSKKRVDFDLTKYAKTTSLPVIKVIAANRIQQKKSVLIK